MEAADGRAVVAAVGREGCRRLALHAWLVVHFGRVVTGEAAGAAGCWLPPPAAESDRQMGAAASPVDTLAVVALPVSNILRLSDWLHKTMST